MLQAASSAGRLPAGVYLFGARPTAASRSSVELEFDLTAILARLNR